MQLSHTWPTQRTNLFIDGLGEGNGFHRLLWSTLPDGQVYWVLPRQSLPLVLENIVGNKTDVGA